jgi:hypothetical protein
MERTLEGQSVDDLVQRNNHPVFAHCAEKLFAEITVSDAEES